MNGLFLGFSKVGGSVWLRGDNARELAIYLGDASVSFEVDAVGAKTHARRNTENQRNVDNKLYLALAHQGQVPGVTTQWEDRDGCPLEDQITDVIVGMAVAGEHLQRRWLEQKAAWEKKRKEEEERRACEQKAEAEWHERERLTAMEKAILDALLADAAAWRDADTIRAYVAAARNAAAGRADKSAFEDWTRWALAEADRLDPISSGRIFGKLDKDGAL